ncbi:unnamed protein product [Pieris macdunnoughi]|uniref:Uncharacterized protein n=1 Tax=Pieris macdunnoughi TaxID=345717 RepID=A0A821VMQ5_9NEOP|nr:unnamed protein product [Pieris macdunnoughi]
MLSGAIWSAAPVSLRPLAPGLPAARPPLLALVMQALHDDDTSFLGAYMLFVEAPDSVAEVQKGMERLNE